MAAAEARHCRIHYHDVPIVSGDAFIDGFMARWFPPFSQAITPEICHFYAAHARHISRPPSPSMPFPS